MGLKHIRETYNVPAFRGTRVKALGLYGVITGAHGERIRVRVDGVKTSCIYHPTCGIEYLTDQEAAVDVIGADA